MEVGVRKVMGANRTQIVQQFWSEALILSFLGLVLGIALSEMLLPVFNSFVHQQLTLTYYDEGPLLLLLFGIVGLIAGSYPALVLSRFQPISVLKGETRIGGRNQLTRTLIIFQYAASITLIVGTGVMLQQQDYLRNKNLGFNKEQVAIIHANRKIAKPYKQEILKDPRIQNVTISDRILIDGYSWVRYKMPDGSEMPIRIIGVDVDYLSTLEISLIEGRNFSEMLPSDRDQSILINETLVKQLGLENPVGKPLQGFRRDNIKNATVIGIIRDFHTESLHAKITPLALLLEKYSWGPFLLIRLPSHHTHETIEMLKSTWDKMAPNKPFALSFLDEQLDRQYHNEAYWFQILSYSALIAIALSCLGLFGLASLAVVRRTKEVGIRKVLGASANQLMWLLSKDFVKLLLVSNVIAAPMAYWMMDKWLGNFAYRIDLSMGVFVAAGTLTLVIALLTVNVQTLKAARSNPVDALRDE